MYLIIESSIVEIFHYLHRNQSQMILSKKLTVRRTSKSCLFKMHFGCVINTSLLNFPFGSDTLKFSSYLSEILPNEPVWQVKFQILSFTKRDEDHASIRELQYAIRIDKDGCKPTIGSPNSQDDEKQGKGARDRHAGFCLLQNTW